MLGTFKVDDAKWRHFSDKVMEIDSEAVFSRNDPLVVRHSTCRAFLHLEEPYQPGPFKLHVHKCDVKCKVLRKDTMTLSGWVVHNPSGNSKARVSLCSGLKVNVHMQLQVLLSLPTDGGSGCPLSAIAEELYGSRYKDLTMSQKEEVD